MLADSRKDARRGRWNPRWTVCSGAFEWRRGAWAMVGLRAAAVVAQVVATHAGCVAKLPGGGTQE